MTVLQGLIAFFALLGGYLALRDAWRAFQDWRTISWRRVEEAAAKLFSIIRRSGYTPDLIVGIGRGGLITAGLLAARFRQSKEYRMSMIPVAAIDRFYLKVEGRRKSVRFSGFHSLDIYDKQILVVNADTYTGSTLGNAKRVLEWDRPKTVKTGTLFAFTKRAKSPPQDPDFWGEQLSESQRRRPLPWRDADYHFDTVHDVESVSGTLAVLHGFVAAGKTSVADAITKGLRFSPLYSDSYWFRYGIERRDHDRSENARHNEHMLGRCWSALGSGSDVVLDCTSRVRSYREDIRRSLAKTDVTLIFVWCLCSEESALERIERRTFIGPHDFGTKFEYQRVKKSFENFGANEEDQSNVLKVDTDGLECEIWRAVSEEAEEEMRRIKEVIEQHYFTKVEKR